MTEPSRPSAALSFFEAQRDEAIDLLRCLVEIDSPTADKAGVDRVGAILAGEFRASGARIASIDSPSSGNPLRAVIPPAEGRASGGPPPALLLGHLDTVWPLGEAARRPFRVEGPDAFGPGVFDMKAGLVLCVLLARARKAGVFRPCLPVVCFFSSDEETGSPVSRPHLEAEARGARYVLGLEPCNPDGGAKTARKGVGRLVVEVEGRSAHAGIDPEKGVNAIEELAAQILALKLLEGRALGTTVHAGLVSGGVAKNVVAPRARAELDVRVPSSAEWRRVETEALSLRLRDPRARLRVEAALTHPPMERTEGVAALYDKARTIALRAGFDLAEGSTGGGSDGSYCAALGVPVLDGLGVEGDGAHALHERVVVDRIAPRAALLAGILEAVDRA